MKKATLAPVSTGVADDKNPAQMLHCLRQYVRLTACTLSPLSLLLTFHQHTFFQKRMSWVFGLSYVARCPT